MRRMALLSIATLLASLLGLGAARPATVFGAGPNNTPREGSPNRLLVTMRAGHDRRALTERQATNKGQLRKTVEAVGLLVVDVPDGDTEAVAKAYRSDPAVLEVTPDYALELAWAPNDPNYNDGKQWGPQKIGAPAAWDVSSGAGVTIAIVDSGVDPTHPDLQGRLLPGYNTYSYPPSTDTTDRCGHGTHLAGIVAATADNGQGVAGIAYNSLIMPVKAVGDNCGGSYSSLIDGIVWAADHGARVIVVSSGASLAAVGLLSAINYARDHGAIVVAAAGNTGSAGPYYPASYGPAFAVSGTNLDDTRYAASTFGNQIDLSAPAQSIYSTFWSLITGSTYAYMTGTSDAAPHVAGVAALILAQHPEYTVDQVEDALRSTADDLGDPGWDQYFGWGRVNASRALGAGAVPPPSTPEPTPLPTPIPEPTTPPPSTPEPTPSPSPEPTPSPVPSATLVPATMHVGDLDGGLTIASRGAQASVVVMVHDSTDVPVAGVVVKAAWTGASSPSGTCTTGLDGQCSMTTSLKKSGNSVILAIKGLTKPGYKYVSGANHDIDGGSDGTRITINP